MVFIERVIMCYHCLSVGTHILFAIKWGTPANARDWLTGYFLTWCHRKVGVWKNGNPISYVLGIWKMKWRFLLGWNPLLPYSSLQVAPRKRRQPKMYNWITCNVGTVSTTRCRFSGPYRYTGSDRALLGFSMI